MSARRLTLDIDRVVVRGSALGTSGLEGVRERMESELARTIRGASWPNESLDTRSVRIAGDTPLGAGEHALAERVITAVMQALGSSPAGDLGNE